MKLLTISVLILTVFTINLSNADESAFVTFTGEAPAKYEQSKQPLTLYACNNTQIDLHMEWNKENRNKVPYGFQTKDGKDFFISKYYIASPPLPNSFSAGKPLILGVLSEDHFPLFEPEMNVNVFMNYKLLKPIQLGFLSVNYSNGGSGIDNCIDQNINTIPINIRCPSFEYTKDDKIGLGKGIAQLSRVKNSNGQLTDEGQLFIPLNIETKKALEHCTVEILNDIIAEHQVYFGSADHYQEKLDLTHAYEAYKRQGKHVNLYCRARPEEEPATGCNPILFEKE